MPKAKLSRSITALAQSDSEDDQLGESSLLSQTRSPSDKMAPAKRGRGRPKASSVVVTGRVAKTKPASRRSSDRIKPARAISAIVSPVKGTKRKALSKKAPEQQSDVEVQGNGQNDDTTMGETDILEASVVAAKGKGPKPTQGKATATRGRPPKKVSTPTDYSIKVDETPEASKVAPRRRRKPAASKKDVSVEPEPEEEVAETQVPNEMEVDSFEEEMDSTIPEPAPLERNRSKSQTRPAPSNRRVGTSSDNERSDPALRRRLGDMTKKLEALETKYKDLRELGVKDAEKVFDKLKKQVDEKEKLTKSTIAALRTEIAAERVLSKEAQILRKRLEVQQKEMADLNVKISDADSKLAEAQVENKALSTKLATSRSAAASVESVNSRVPGSAVKANGGIRMIGTAEAAQAAQAAQLKGDLYSDLTGLLILGVKRESEDDVFDCIQTGRNGTLHFKLSITNEKSAESYDDAQCVYTPLLDPSRDKELIDLLPDYLADEITFPRPQSAKFYARVIRALTESSSN
ncbi:chromosome segregation protein [Phlyctema vagabunda]|uniref:Chromosome segregation protein n=1 Tax=Phlyctema vagabunda TaxID=108571 RepID=A0ABR4P4W5_9HELO